MGQFVDVDFGNLYATKLPSWNDPWPSSVKNLFDGGSVFLLEITVGYKKEVAFGKIILFVLALPVEVFSLNPSVVREERGGLISVEAIQINHLERGCKHKGRPNRGTSSFCGFRIRPRTQNPMAIRGNNGLPFDCLCPTSKENKILIEKADFLSMDIPEPSQTIQYDYLSNPWLNLILPKDASIVWL